METIKIKVAGELIQARVGETVVHSLWNAGKAELIKTGCVGGVCGACTITVRSPEGKMIGTDLACMCPVEDGMEVFPCPVDLALTVEPESNPTEEKLRKSLLRLMDALEDHDDIQKVYSNFDIADEVMTAMEQSS